MLTRADLAKVLGITNVEDSLSLFPSKDVDRDQLITFLMWNVYACWMLSVSKSVEHQQQFLDFNNSARKGTEAASFATDLEESQRTCHEETVAGASQIDAFSCTKYDLSTVVHSGRCLEWSGHPLSVRLQLIDFKIFVGQRSCRPPLSEVTLTRTDNVESIKTLNQPSVNLLLDDERIVGHFLGIFVTLKVLKSETAKLGCQCTENQNSLPGLPSNRNYHQISRMVCRVECADQLQKSRAVHSGNSVCHFIYGNGSYEVSRVRCAFE